MADKENSNDNKKKKSIIASLDLKNYKAKYTDSYGLGKPNEVNLDNFLIAEPDPEADDKKNLEKSVDDKITKVENKVNDEPITADTKKVIDPNNSTVKNTIEPTEPSKVSIRDDDFERRVNAEADNDFYDDKPAQQINETFRSGAIKSKSTAENNFNPVGDDASKEIKLRIDIDNKYLTWKTAHEDVDNQRRAGFVGEKFEVQTKLVNKNYGKFFVCFCNRCNFSFF